MRQIGSIHDDLLAQRLADYLVTQGIFAQSDKESDGWAIWVKEENHVERAREIFREFQENPQDRKYEDAKRDADRQRQSRIRQQVARNVIDVRRDWNLPLRRRAPLVYTLMGLCVFATLAADFGRSSQTVGYSALAFCDEATYLETGDGLYQIKQGQIWRLVTPIFLHGDLIHLLVNLSCMYYFAPQLEARLSSLRFGAFVLALALAANLCQYFATHRPQFVGISGVVFGMGSYIWVHQWLSPRSGLHISDGTMVTLVAILVLGFLAELSPEGSPFANWSHLGGFAGGAVIALGVHRRTRPTVTS